MGHCHGTEGHCDETGWYCDGIVKHCDRTIGKCDGKDNHMDAAVGKIVMGQSVVVIGQWIA